MACEDDTCQSVLDRPPLLPKESGILEQTILNYSISLKVFFFYGIETRNILWQNFFLMEVLTRNDVYDDIISEPK